MAIGQNGSTTLVDGSGSGRTLFYRMREVNANSPIDTDLDGIDDLYELNHPALLNALNPSDALEDFDGDGISNLEEYRLGSDPAVGIFFNYTTIMPSPTTVNRGLGQPRKCHPFLQAPRGHRHNYHERILHHSGTPPDFRPYRTRQ